MEFGKPFRKKSATVFLAKIVALCKCYGLAVGVIVGLVSTLNPSVGAAMRSGFGLVDWLMCLSPLLFLLQWFFWRPDRKAWMGSETYQIASVAMAAFISGASYAAGLIVHINISISYPEYDRSHSSTLCYLYVLKLLSFVVIGVYFSWQALSMNLNSRVVIKGERSAAPVDSTVGF